MSPLNTPTPPALSTNVPCTLAVMPAGGIVVLRQDSRRTKPQMAKAVTSGRDVSSLHTFATPAAAHWNSRDCGITCSAWPG